ncbi:CRISPR-associated helicase Cas3' [Pelotomaculum propionicicum]|uniref:Putative CRISPR-associated nuclease/helicase Cas3 n=1 Tax=Pelotomaculum propionicicum TaxID=258475 RepID=A0A4Y7RWK2_9FIRM|nr:CRISPR-associated helicase Cas3' [Pelotomaculum propionicicum]TEB13233.1 putative CRISPR-associated nuclease/helicase Cas3 [Pelotomaculum propionicicum]
MSQKEYFAHYNGCRQLLAEHLNNVAMAMQSAVPPSLHFPALSHETVREIGFWMGYLHDLGKYTDFFQDYLLKKISSPHKQHAHISSFYLHGRLLHVLPGPDGDRRRCAAAFLAYVAVRRHHLPLSLSGLFPDYEEEPFRGLLKALWEHLEIKKGEVLEDSGLIERLTPEFFKQIGDPDTRWRDKRNFLFMPQHLAQRLKDVQWYFFLLYIFSLLIDKDKLDSAGVETREISFIPHHLVPAYLSKKRLGNARLRSIREEARLSMLGRISALHDNEIRKIRFMTITAPTGLGKTLAALECALLLRERIERAEKYTPRIISAIPYINIIEQTRQVYEQVLAGGTKQAGRLVIHHSLADISRNDGDKNEEVPLEQILLEVESWEGDVILTTFVQLFHSLLTGNNRMLKKVHKLAGSIVILDEVQSLPDRYQPLIGAILRKMGEFYGTRFILMTATQPKILEFGDLLLQENGRGGGEPLELLQDHKRYFSQNRRTKLISLLKEKLDTETFAFLIAGCRKPGQSVLVVVNTIRRSVELFRALKERFKKEPDNPKILYLSTNIMPMRRKQVIEEARVLLRQKNPVIMVSTQTIEAGVDLDFDLGFRDLAPLESLIQAAGRVNREGEKGEYLPVYVVSVKDDAQRVYAFHHINRTRAMLEKKEEILENEYGRLVEEYYDQVFRDGVSEESRHIWEEGVMKLNFEVLQDFKLIDNTGEVVDVFVEVPTSVDPASLASRLADAYEEALADRECWDWKKFDGLIDESIPGETKERPDFFQRKAILRVLRSKINDYVIQVRKYHAAKNNPVDFCARGGVKSNLLWIPPGQLEDYYDSETGFKDKSGRAFMF